MPKKSLKYREVTRPAVARGIPVRLVDALIEVAALDEADITRDSKLAEDLGLDEMDLVELGEQLGIEDACLDWVTVGDAMRAITRTTAVAV